MVALVLATAGGAIFVASPLPAGLLERRPVPAIRFTDRTGRLLREVRSRADGRSVPLPPAEVPKDPLERGLFVQRWIEPYEGGGQIRTVRAGELVRVRVRIGSNQERFYVAASVPIPAGLEIVDTSLATTARKDPVRKAEGPEEGYEAESVEDDGDVSSGENGYEDVWGGRFWSPFVFEEKRDDRMVLFADRLPPGMHVASFVARATTPGEFALTPAHAEEMYAPETFGRSDGGTFKVVANETVASR